MFDLEQAIKQWRERLRAGGIKPVENLDEVEAHLRDDIEQEIQSGKTEQIAFEIAAARLGDTALLGEEFSKVQSRKPAKRPKYLMLFCLVSAGLITWTTMWALLEGPGLSMVDVPVFTCVLLVAGYLGALPFCYRKLPTINNGAVQKTIAVASLVVQAWIILALLHALGIIRLQTSEAVTALFWAFVPAVFATILAYNGFAMGGQDAQNQDLSRKLTVASRAALDKARLEAAALHHDFLGTEHLLLGLLQMESPILAAVLKQYRLDQAVIRREIGKFVTRGLAAKNSSNIPCTPRTRRVLKLATQQAAEMKHEEVGIEHLLLGLVIEPDGVAGIVLRNLGVDPTQLRLELIRKMGGDSGQHPALAG